MSYYAMVVVVEANDENAAHDQVTRGVGDWPLLVGEPWPVEPIIGAELPSDGVTDAPEFDSLDCVYQHPEQWVPLA